jgi:hypothetical protein
MRKINYFVWALVLLLQLAMAGQNTTSAIAQTRANHGGKIGTTYDGVNYETVMMLDKMQISCAGIKDAFNKGTCVSMMVSLHCPGVQAFHVKYVTLHLLFKTDAWDKRHAPDQRDLTVIVNNETLRLGRMKLISQETDAKMTETLGVEFPYEVFKKISAGQFVEMQVGPNRFMLRTKNLDALRDLNNRVVAAN